VALPGFGARATTIGSHLKVADCAIAMLVEVKLKVYLEEGDPFIPGEGQLQQQVGCNVDESAHRAAPTQSRPTTPIWSRGSAPVAGGQAGRCRLSEGLRKDVVDVVPTPAGAVGVAAVGAVRAVAGGAVPAARGKGGNTAE